MHIDCMNIDECFFLLAFSTQQTIQQLKCTGCVAYDCGLCKNCKDMKKFGGKGRKKQKCLRCQCLLQHTTVCVLLIWHCSVYTVYIDQCYWFKDPGLYLVMVTVCSDLWPWWCMGQRAFMAQSDHYWSPILKRMPKTLRNICHTKPWRCTWND